MNSHISGRLGVLSIIARGPEKRSSPPATPQAPLSPTIKYAIAARVIDQDTQEPVSGAEFEVLDDARTVLKKGQTDWQGTIYHEVATAGTYTVRIIGPPSFDEASLKIAEQPSPGFDVASLKIVEAPPPQPPSFDVGSLRFVA